MENVQQGQEHPLFARQLEDRCGGVVNEATWRAWMCRARHPLPCIKRGESARPHRKAYPSVADAMLKYEQGVADYEEVEQAARRCAMGARQ